jgi:predicted dehydrogenase
MSKKIVLVGLGYLGKIHLRLLIEHPQWELSGVYDIDQKLSKEIGEKYNLKVFATLEEAVESADAVDIVTPGPTHFEIAKLAVTRGKHVFIEKPATVSLKEAQQLQTLVNEARILAQVGHVERFNPAFVAAQPYLAFPSFLEIHRLAQYNPRGTDVSVVLDLMMHDIDLVLSTVKSNVKRITARGATLVSKSADIAYAHIEFDNGCVANITANRMAVKNQRKFRVFTKNNFVTVNLLDKITEVISIQNATSTSESTVIQPLEGPAREMVFQHPVILPGNAINEELTSFYNSVQQNKAARVSLEDAIKALDLAFEIETRIHS